MNPATTMAPHKPLHWPLDRLGEGLEELARRSGLGVMTSEVLVAPKNLDQRGARELGRWIEWAAGSIDLEAEALATSASDLAQLIGEAGPSIFHIPSLQGPQFFLLLRTRGQTAHLLGPDMATHRIPVGALREILCGPYEAPFLPEIDQLLDTAGIPRNRRLTVSNAMLRERLVTQQIGHCWLLRASPASSFWRQVKTARLPGRIGLMMAAFALGYLLEIAGWSLMGMTTLNGQLDMGWMLAWGILVFSLIPVRLLGGWMDASFAVEFGRLLKARLLTGSLRMDIETSRHMGAGQLLSRVMDSQALESLAFNGGMGVLVACLELAFAASILVAGTGGVFHLALLAGWLGLILAMRWNYMQRLAHWTRMRLNMTHDLVERMVGHRTRLAQEQTGRRVQEDDVTLQNYLDASRALDRSLLPVVGVMPRGWLVVGLLGLAPGLVAGNANMISLAIGFGGVMLANRALSGISSGLSALASARLAWRNVDTLFHAAAQKTVRSPFLELPDQDQVWTRAPAPSNTGFEPASSPKARLIDASQLVFRYQTGGEAVLRGADLTVYKGDLILLQGPSGGGKSTLASLLVGLRKPESGLLLLNGLDRHTLGDAWHQLATEAPQFHENHILSGSLAFNLLMGRNWPASEAEIEEAKLLCFELGLGGLIERMPSGMLQRVGETGWQLSHGERSRIFLARALLQKAELTVLDESFAALDPPTLEMCLQCAIRRSATLLVIAHP